MHIILLILKIIGWILLILLGIIVLAVCVVLFTPLKYQVSARCDGELSGLTAKADFSLFFHLIRGSVRYIEQQVSWELHLAWKKIGSEPEEEERTTRAPEHAGPGEDRTDTCENADSAEEASLTEEVCSHAESMGEERVSETETSTPTETVPVETETSTSTETVPVETETSTPTETVPVETETSFLTETPSPSEGASSVKAEKESVFSKLTALIEKLKCTCKEICDKIKELLRKKEILTEFVTDAAHQAALKKLLAELKKLLRRLTPKNFRAEIHFGFDDPAVTGKVLAGISMIYPMICERAEIHPDFQQQILKGNLFLKGKVRAVIFAAAFWNLLWNVNVRRTVIDIKNFKF